MPMYSRQHLGRGKPSYAHDSSNIMQRCMLVAQYADSDTLNVPLMNRITTSPYMWISAITDSCPSELFSTEGGCTGFPPFCTATSKACFASSTEMPAATRRFPNNSYAQAAHHCQRRNAKRQPFTSPTARTAKPCLLTNAYMSSCL